MDTFATVCADGMTMNALQTSTHASALKMTATSTPSVTTLDQERTIADAILAGKGQDSNAAMSMSARVTRVIMEVRAANLRAPNLGVLESVLQVSERSLRANQVFSPSQRERPTPNAVLLYRSMVMHRSPLISTRVLAHLGLPTGSVACTTSFRSTQLHAASLKVGIATWMLMNAPAAHAKTEQYARNQMITL